MEYIFHEKQEGSLCAQHCLNALLQGSYYTAVDLADLARQLDESEREQMAEAGTQSDEYRMFLQQPSSNFDDSGYFSLQVLQTALRVWSLELLPYNSSDIIAIAARQNPIEQAAFICNFRDHWLAIRRLGHQWFNLNSLLTAPELISDTFLSMLLTQLQQEGYSIFVVVGSLPDCEADKLLRLMRAVQPIKPRLISDTEKRETASSDDGGGTSDMQREAFDDDNDLQAVLEQSRRWAEDDELQHALAASMKDSTTHIPTTSSHISGTTHQPSPTDTRGGSEEATQPDPSGPGPLEALSPQELRERRMAFLDRLEGKSSTAGAMTDEEMLQAAINMSMQMSE